MMEGLTKNVVLFEREDVRLAENGDVFTGTLSEISQIRKNPERFQTEINFRRDMTSEEVGIVLREKFPLLQNRRFSCAARKDARLNFCDVRGVWDGQAISKLKGNSALYLVMEEEELMDFSQLSTGYFDLDENGSTQWISQSVTQGSADSDLGLTDETSRPMTLPADNTSNGTVEAMAHIAPVPAQSQPYHSQAAEARCTYTDTRGRPDSGFSSEENAWVDSQARELPDSIPPEAGVEVKPSKGPLEGGGVFRLRFDRSLPDAVTSACALFGNKQVEVSKSCECSRTLYGESIPAGEVPGTVPVTITTKNGVYLGKTLFTYVDQKEEMSEMLKQIVKSRKLKGELFKMLGRQCETDESEENNTRTFGLPSDGQQRQAMDILQCLVYTAAEIGAEEFIQMIFSTPAGRIVFEAYKKESSLPEDMAEANGHEDIATFLRAITKRFSEEDTTSQGTSLLELARACACEEKEEKEEQSVSWPCETDVKQLKKDDLSEREYFGDAETSSSDSEKERCDSEDQFEAGFSADHDPIHLGLDPSYQMTERDIYHYQLAEMIRDKWRDLARALKYTEANIDSIEKEQGSSIKECCIEVLVCWMRREGPNATVKKLASALSKVELRNVADVLMCMDTNQVEIKEKQQGDEEKNKTANELAGSSTDNSITTQTRKQDDGFDQFVAAAVINQPGPERIVQLQDSRGESQPALEERKGTNSEVPEIEVSNTFQLLSITQSNSSCDEDSAACEERKKKKSRKNKRAVTGQKNDDAKDEVNKLARENETTKNSIDNLKREKSSLEENLEEEWIAIKGSKMCHTVTDLEDKLSKMYEETEREKSKMRSKIEQLEKMLQDSELQCSTLRSKVSELEGELVIQRQQQQDNEEGVAFNLLNQNTWQENITGEMTCKPADMGYPSFVDLQPLDRLTEADIHSPNLPHDIGTRWRDLARQLGFKEELINSIQDEKDFNKERCIAVLVKWMEREGQQGTCEKLATALASIGLQNLAERLIGPLNMSGRRMCVEIEKTIKLGDASQTQIMLVRDSTGKKKFHLWKSEENEFETLFEELKNSVNATVQISVNTPELGTKILKKSEVKDFVEVSEELERLEEKLSNILSNLEMGELKEESFPIPNKLGLLNRESRTLQELYTKVTGMTGEACKCDELGRRKFYDFTYHSLRAVHNDLCARAADLQSEEETMKEKEKETLKNLLSYQRGREKQVAHLERLWIGLFSPTIPPLKKSQSSPPEREHSKPPSDVKKLRAYSDTASSMGDLTKWFRSRKYTFSSTSGKSEDNCPDLLSFSKAGEKKC